MSYPFIQPPRDSGINKYFYPGKKFLIALLSILMAGCAASGTMNKPFTLSGTFRGSASEGLPVDLTLHQEKNTVTGQGLIGGRPFILSGLTSWHGPLLTTYGDGTVASAYVTLSPDGQNVKIRGLGLPFSLARGGEPVDRPSGPFEGRYSYPGPPRIDLSLTQHGELVAGTGFVEGKAVAVVGKATGLHMTSGTLLFSDESQNGVKGTLSADGHILTIHGLGGPIEMRRN